MQLFTSLSHVVVVDVLTTLHMNQIMVADNDSTPADPLDDEAIMKWHRLQDFQHHHRHSLRISVSNIAAMTGFHPFRSLPEVMMKLVYQGSMGQALLQHDAALLQLEMIDEETVLMDLARKASLETSQALQLALQVKQGTAKLDTIQKARAIKQRIVDEAQKAQALTKEEFKVLQEGARSAIDTGYGTCHEDAALDLYEVKCGWNVRDRNAEILMWPFRRIEQTIPTGVLAPLEEQAEDDAQDEQILLRATAIPMRAPSSCWKRAVEAQPDEEDDEESRRENKRIKTTTTIDTRENDSSHSVEQDNTSDQEKAQENVMPSVVSEGDASTLSATTELLRQPPPFFYILGSVDGIREEMFPVHPSSSIPATSTTLNHADGGSKNNCNEEEEEEQWLLRDIIVECKHRMNKIHPIPPLYEQIQTTAYCLMYQVTEADIIQVIRKDKPEQQQQQQRRSQPHLPTPSEPLEKETKNTDHHQESTILNYFPRNDKVTTRDDSTTDLNQATAVVTEDEASNVAVAHANNVASLSQIPHEAQEQPVTTTDNNNNNNNNNNNVGGDDNDMVELADIEIAVNRISIDEPLYQHRMNWDKVVLPRLCSFVDAVYRIRACDEKRYRLLLAMTSTSSSTSSSSLLDAWNLVHEECPWLLSCDTAFRQDVGMGFGNKTR